MLKQFLIIYTNKNNNLHSQKIYSKNLENAKKNADKLAKKYSYKIIEVKETVYG